VQHAAREIVLADEDALDAQRTSALVEQSLVRPGAAVDVVDEDVPAPLGVLDFLELARPLVHEPLDRDELELAGTVEREVRRRSGVVEDGRREQDPLAALGAVCRPEAGERVLLSLLTILDRRSVEHALAAVAVGLVQDRVAERVGVR
jgi:hypothetical protein